MHKGYKCLHVPTNRVYISRDVVFDEHVFPFSNLPQPATVSTPSLHSSPMLLDQFVDAARSPSLLSNHGAGTDRGARLHLLDDPPVAPAAALTEDVDHAAAASRADPCMGHAGLHARSPAMASGPTSSAPTPPSPGPAMSTPGLAMSAPSASRLLLAAHRRPHRMRVS